MPPKLVIGRVEKKPGEPMLLRSIKRYQYVFHFRKAGMVMDVKINSDFDMETLKDWEFTGWERTK